MTQKELKKYKLKILKRKKIKTKIGLFHRIILKKIGEYDAKHRIVRMTDNNIFSSPFILKEQSYCMSAILKEEELLTKILAHINSDVILCNVELEQNEYSLKILNESEYNVDSNIALANYFSRDDNKSVLIKFFESHSELMQEHSKIIKNKWIYDNSGKIKIEEYVDSLLIKREIEITCNRCYQIYERMISRISAYWGGVLKIDSKSKTYPPIFDTKALLLPIAEKVSLIKDKFEVYFDV